MRPQTSRTSNSTGINIDVSFVRDRILENYEELCEAQTLTRFVHILNKVFQDKELTFVAAKGSYQMVGLHEECYTDIGIVEGQTIYDGKISVILWSEVLHTIVYDEVKLIRLLSGLIRHELVHREQTTRSNMKCHFQHPKRNIDKMEEWAQYYFDRHEHAAFAHEIVEVLQQKHLTNERILEEIAKPVSAFLCRHVARYQGLIQALEETSQLRDSIRHVKKCVYKIVSQM